ncbi:MAG: patatin-like protein [Actinomycetota bacterium]|nr:patatin-like protein [Actinomycetota bacterium]
MSLADGTTEDLSLELDEEVRLAVVMYGGVSLAIYMYGVAEELWRLVRATCPERAITDPLDPPDAVRLNEDESTEPVYRELARARGGGKIRSRFLVDIISGTSAGGINGVFLATALANDTALSALKSVWVDEGAIGTLVNDDESLPRQPDGSLVDGFEEGLPPKSLLNGRRMLYALESALSGMSGETGDTDSPLVDELDLWVTATDLDGLELPIRLANAMTRERRYANRYQFRFSRRDDRNDFTKDVAPFIAYTARSTSAFPFAFEPIRLETLPPFATVTNDWRKFYSDYRNDLEESFPHRSFSDGGILDNKPFSYATDTLARRRTSVSVDRKLIYIEPDPADLSPDVLEAKDWNAIETVQAALMGIPRKEAIRQDINDVVKRNRSLERVRGILARSGTDPSDFAAVMARLAPPDPVAFAATPLREILLNPSLQWGPSYATYYRLKVADTIDYLAALVTRAVGLSPESDEAWVIRQLVAGWKGSHYDERPADDQKTDNAFMLDFGAPYRARRTIFVHQKLKDLQTGSATRRSATLEAAGLDPPSLPAVENESSVYAPLRVAFADALEDLDNVEVIAGDPEGPVVAALATGELTAATLQWVLEAPETDRASRIGEVLDTNASAIAAAAEAIKGIVATAAESARTKVGSVLGSHFSAREMPGVDDFESRLKYALRFYYDAFEAYDLVLYPIQYATPLGETNPVEIIRISPVDATARNRLPSEVRELMGSRLHHFAGFLDSTWRQHDMVWGRMHGAECLIRALAPPASVPALVDQAHDRILRDYAAELGESPDPTPLGWFAARAASQTRSPPLAGTLKRATPVIATILTDILNARAGILSSVWAALRSALPDKPGGIYAVVAMLVGLAKIRPRLRAAMLVLPLIIAVGVGLIVAPLDYGWTILGIVLLSGAATVTISLVALLWLVASTVRSTVTSRVQTFVNPS